jgi:hypothetical protein
MKTRSLLLTGVLLAATFLAGCSKPAATETAKKNHGHVAPHGGVLVEIGEHQFNVEFVHDEESGKLSAYTLDAHAENFLRTAMASFDVFISAGGETRTISFKPVANAASGETVGDTSQYDATDPWLKDKHAFAGIIGKIDFRGTVFTDVPFRFTEAKDDDHDHEKH